MVRVLRSAECPVQKMRLMMIVVEWQYIVRSECVKDEGTDCEDGRVTMIGKGEQNLTCFVY